MGRTNQETWKQPPVSLNVEWPTDKIIRRGPTLEEQKARMRETRAKVANVIAASGYPVPIWPDVGQPVNWSTSQDTSLRGETIQTSSSRIPRRYQTSTPVSDAKSPLRLARGVWRQRSDSSPLSRPPTLPQAKTHQSVATSSIPEFTRLDQERYVPLRFKSSNPPKTSLTYYDLPSNIDPSIFNPRVFVVALPDSVFLRTPPKAPRAMLERFSERSSTLSGLQQSARNRKNSEAIKTTNHSYRTARGRAHGDSWTTKTGSHHEPVLPDCDDHSESGESLKTVVTRATLLPPPGLAQGPSSAATNTVNHQDSRVTCNIGTPPGFENRHAAGVVAAKGSGRHPNVWVSKVVRLRADFARMQKQAHHLGMDKSPFLPKNTVEYANVLAEMKSEAANDMRKKIQHPESQHLHGNVEKDTISLPSHELQLFFGRRMEDMLSPVLAMKTCFNETPHADERDRVDWPPGSEFRYTRVSRRRKTDRPYGQWPTPRVNTAYRPGKKFQDSEIPYGDRKLLTAPRWDWVPKPARSQDDGAHDGESHLPAPDCIPLASLRIINPTLAAFIQDIDAIEGGPLLE